MHKHKPPRRPIGKNADTSALMRIRVSQFALVVTKERPGSWFDVLGLVGGAHGIIFMFASAARFVFLRGRFTTAGDMLSFV